jgi:type IV secretory pathway VirB2 component (pilin)
MKAIRDSITGPLSPLKAAIIGCVSLSLGMLMFGVGG